MKFMISSKPLQVMPVCFTTDSSDCDRGMYEILFRDSASVLHLRNAMNEISSSVTTFECLKQHYNPFAEEIGVIPHNAQQALIDQQMFFRATVDYCMLPPRDIFRFLIQSNACSFIMAHNHPSKDVLPSEQDLAITRKFFKLSYLFEIPLLDHIVFSDDKYFSMADHGYMHKWKRNRFIR